MKARLVLILVGLQLVGGGAGVPGFAEEPSGLQAEIGASMLWGNAYELVLRDKTYQDPQSRLTWPVSPMVGPNLIVRQDWASWTASIAELRAARWMVTGTLVDEDWNVGTLVSGRSEHQSRVTSYLQGRFEQEFRWKPWMVGLGVLYRSTSWEGWNGTYRYQTTTGTSTGSISGLGLAYRLEWVIPYLSAGWTATWGPTTWTPGFRLAPYTWGFDRDDHLLADKRYTYLDNVEGGVYGALSLEVAFPQKGWDWGLRGGWDVAWGAIGSSQMTYPTLAASAYYATFEKAAGAWFEEGSLTLFVRN